MRHILPLLVVVGASLVVGAACSDEEILLARVPDVAAEPSAAGGRCTADADCSESTFCARARCGDVAGTCEARPVFCEDAPAPVCGCDGVTYWNDCLRRVSGVTGAAPGECAQRGLRCGGPDGATCPDGALCARLLPPDLQRRECPPDAPGQCWALPAVCPAQAGADRWVPCGPVGDACATTCEAIRSGTPHRRARTCP